VGASAEKKESSEETASEQHDETAADKNASPSKED
jgi:hypothetical protein